MKHIVCFHLFNDYSGSPRVLHGVLDSLLRQGYRIDLVTSRGGVLDSLDGHERLKIHHYPYRFSNNAAVTMLRYAGIQLYTFFFALKYLLRRNTIFYINTLLPVGPALAGRLTGKKVVYHYHENAPAKGGGYKLLSRIMQWLASAIVCVSEYQRGFLKRQKNVIVVSNTLPPDFCAAFGQVRARTLPAEKTVLMLASLKTYKGLAEFISLARRLPRYRFRLVIGDTRANVDAFFSGCPAEIPGNLEILDRREDVVPFYRDAALVLNLSDRTQVVETFGLTALEAMTAALPVIVPTVGGIAELVEDGVTGYRIDAGDLERIERRIDQILSDGGLYETLSRNAKKRADLYNEKQAGKLIGALLERV
ncbi:glycosyltransferase family 4 protein [uncultured Alistipes sp.]|jgi:hypothetical protein|uniref:glycosyltransferase family 4 protein n=1 Tax=uncultured Alistipes sp. TaxID=538949 RepID=UPI0025CD94F1|nr:glycosyltransferase family 4 protein [uncultured Alistipes sp.]